MRPDLPDLESIPFLAQAQQATKQRVLASALLQGMPSGVTLLEQGGEAHFLYVVVSGTVAATVRAGERSSIVLMAGPGSALPVSAIVSDAPMLTSAHTIEESRLLMIPASLVRQLVQVDAQLAMGLLQYIAGANRRMVTQLFRQKTATTAERLASWILDEGGRWHGSNEIPLSFPKQHLASYLGTSPENLSRAITVLRQIGTRVEKRRIIISDLESLRQVASGFDPEADTDAVLARTGVG